MREESPSTKKRTDVANGDRGRRESRHRESVTETILSNPSGKEKGEKSSGVVVFVLQLHGYQRSDAYG